jgi:hypothetical protein
MSNSGVQYGVPPAMTYDLRGIADTLKLPGKVIAGLFLFTLLLLAFDFFELVRLPDLHAVARPAVIIAALLFGSLCVAAVGAVIVEAVKRRRRPTLVAQRREIRRKEWEQAKVEQEAKALERLDYLSAEEIGYIADALRKNEQSFTTWVHSPHMSNLMAKGLVNTPGGTHNQDYYPFYFTDFAWKALLVRKDEFIAKDDEQKRRQAA